MNKKELQYIVFNNLETAKEEDLISLKFILEDEVKRVISNAIELKPEDLQLIAKNTNDIEIIQNQLSKIMD